jgi:hypothetical protein
MTHATNMRDRYFTLAQAKKNIINDIGTITRIVQKSGCAHTKRSTTQSTIAKGTKPS